MTNRKGIILAGGSGTRLYPLTLGVSKQLLPVYDKPMIYYSLTVLMLSGIRDIIIISTPNDLPQYKSLLDDGSQWGIKLQFQEQTSPDGIAQAFIIAEDFLDGAPSALILGDNIFFGHGLPKLLTSADKNQVGANIFGYHVMDPERYGVLGFDVEGKVNSIVEKPAKPASNFAITGLYFVDGSASKRAKQLKPSNRGELEITSLLESYLVEGNLRVETMGRGFAWLDTGTHTSLLEASNFVKTLIERQGLQIGSPHEVSFCKGWIDNRALLNEANRMRNSEYGNYLFNLVKRYSFHG